MLRNSCSLWVNMKVMLTSESHQAMYKYHVQSSRQQLLEASKIKWFGPTYFVKLQWSIWQAQQFLTGEDLKRKRKQKGEILTITIKNECLGTVHELCSSSPKWCCRCPCEVYPPTGTLVYSLLTNSCASQHVLLIHSRLESFAHPVSTQEMSYESGEEHTSR